MSTKIYIVKHKTEWFMSINADSYAFRANIISKQKKLNNSKESVQTILDSICDKERQDFYQLYVE